MLVRATRTADLWTNLDPWTVRIAVLGTFGAFIAAVAATWAWLTRPTRSWTYMYAIGSLTVMFPAAHLRTSADPGASWARAIGTLGVALGVLVLVQIVAHVLGRAMLAAADEFVRRRGGDGLEKTLDAWLEPQTDMQKIAVLLGSLGALWLLGLSFMPNGFPQARGVIGVIADVGDRFLNVGDGLAIGLITSAAVLWIQSGPMAAGTPSDGAAHRCEHEHEHEPGFRNSWRKSVTVGAAAVAAGIAASRIAALRRHSRAHHRPG